MANDPLALPVSCPTPSVPFEVKFEIVTVPAGGVGSPPAIFGMQQGRSQYRRLIKSFQRLFGATIFFGTDTQREHAAVFHRARFNFMSEARIWYSRDSEAKLLPGGCQNVIVLSDEFYREGSSSAVRRRRHPLEERASAQSDRAIADQDSSFVYDPQHWPQSVTCA